MSRYRSTASRLPESDVPQILRFPKALSAPVHYGRLLAANGLDEKLPMTECTATDEVLIRRIQAGESSLYQMIIDRHHHSLHRMVSNILRGDSDAEDVLQETYLRAFTRLDQFRHESRFSTWLRRIAFNQALQRLRSARHLQYAGDEWVPEYEAATPLTPSESLDPEWYTSAKEIAVALERAVRKLRPSLRSVFILKEVEFLTVRDISARLGVSEACVKTRLHRAKLQLRQSLKDFTSTPEFPAFSAEAA